MAAPADAAVVLSSLRLGWCVAEVRGRYRLDAPTVDDGSLPSSPNDALPLRSERSASDLRTEAGGVLAAVLATLTKEHPTLDTVPGAAPTLFSTEIEAAAVALDDAAGTGAAQKAWDDFAALLHRFDEHVQDTLTAASEQQACAYLLGRGLAESFWALNPNAAMPQPLDGDPTDATSWAFLLGRPRRDELTRLLGRLAPYFNRYTAPAISGSLAVWHKVVTTDKWWAQATAPNDLYEQMRRWYELLLVDQDPTTLIKPFGMLRNLRSAWNAVRLFLPQLLGAAASIVVLLGFVWASGTALANTIGVAVGVVGLSLTSLTAKAKSSAQALTTRLREDAYTDLVSIAITVVPPRTDADQEDHRRHAVPKAIISPTRRSVSAALRDRRLTTAVSA
jgi:hypothetical protein